MLRALAFALALMGSTAAAQQASTGQGATLRVLDKITGIVREVRLENGQQASLGQLTIMLGECRYPRGNPSGDAYAFLSIVYSDDPEPIFRGWMIASAPALNALDHFRYDVWAVRCTT